MLPRAKPATYHEAAKVCSKAEECQESWQIANGLSQKSASYISLRATLLVVQLKAGATLVIKQYFLSAEKF